MNEAIPLGSSITFSGHLAAEDVPKGGEGVVHGLVVDRPVQVLDEHVADSAPPQRWIPLAPHDPHRPPFDQVEVHSLQSPLRVSMLCEVDVGISQGLASDHVSAHSDGEDRAGRGELLKEHRLGGLAGQVADIEGGKRTRLRGVALGHWGAARLNLRQKQNSLNIPYEQGQ